MKKDTILRYHDYDGDILEDIKEKGLPALWNGVHPFEISASECITLTELRSRWPSMTDNYISENFGEGTYLPLAGLEVPYADADTYRCLPVPVKYREYLTISKEHPSYAEKFPHSYQGFLDEHSFIKDFVLPLCEVEIYEQHNPELLRPIVIDLEEHEGGTRHELLGEIASRLSRLDENELIANRKHYLAAVLFASGMVARVSHALQTGKPGIAENGRQDSAREWRNNGLEKLGFDLLELKSKKII